MVWITNTSGRELVSILTKHFGFFFISQKGSHIKLGKKEFSNRITVIVPNHKELAPGTIRGILVQAEIDQDAFIRVIGRNK